jgi:MFS family permease
LCLEYKWRVVALLAAVAAINLADRAAIFSVFPLLKADLHLTDVQLGGTGSFFLWTYGICVPFAGALSDRFSRSKLIVGSLVAWSLVTLATGFVSSAGQLLFTRALLGVAECAYTPAANALIGDYHGASTRGAAIGWQLAGLNLGPFIGSVLAGYLGERYGWRASFIVLGLAGLVLAFFVSLTLRDAKEARPRQTIQAREPWWQALPSLFAVPSYLVMLTEGLFIAAGVWVFLNWLPFYFADTFHMGLAAAGFSGTFALQLAVCAGVLSGGYLSDRIATEGAQRRVLMQGLAYLAGAPFLLLFAGHPGIAVVTLAILAFTYFRAIGNGAEAPILCDLFEPRKRGSAMAVLTGVQSFGGAFGVLVASFLKPRFGLSGIFGGISVLLFIAGAVVMTGYTFFIRRDLEKAGARVQPVPTGSTVT